uniref:Uncharacterized protein n=1 Tax=Arundo donax TaxID=35708 RepID=A0A0A9AI14_ARUDO
MMVPTGLHIQCIMSLFSMNEAGSDYSVLNICLTSPTLLTVK